MKSKIVVLGICCLLSACGFGRGDRNQQLEKDESIAESLFLTNLKSNNFAKLQKVRSGNQYYNLGSFEISSLPAEIRGLATESEMGTLSVEFEDETFAEKYSDEVKSVFKKRQQEIKTTVYLIKDSDSPKQVSFAIRDDELAKQVRVHEESMMVQSSPKPYCYRAHFYIKQLVDKYSILDQDANCDPSGNCAISLRVDVGGSHDVPSTYNLNTSPAAVATRCLDTQTYYSVTEAKVNSSVPKVATVTLNAELSKNTRRLHFDL